MGTIYIPEGYVSELDLKHTQIAIKKIKDFFQEQLTAQLNLRRVTAPLFVDPAMGLNDNLNGYERPVGFDAKYLSKDFEIVQSLAKWKRMALERYGFDVGEGIYTDMNAIRRDEETDNIHSIYVDQWDWEKIISREMRNEEYLKETVRSVYSALQVTEKFVSNKYRYVENILPAKIHFITSQELLDKYPDLDAKEREKRIAKEYGAVFIMKIGETLSDGNPHDGRAPDYDDWSLNGDIIVYYPILDIALELSSMGIRVDADSLKYQLDKRKCTERASLSYHRDILSDKLPLTIGGGIGQSRMCMFFLRKCHIGEVQASAWSDAEIEYAENRGVVLL